MGAVLMASGCGGSSAKPLTTAELTAKADTICKSVSAKLASKTVNSEQGLARLAPELASFEQTALSQLSKLVPPVQLESDWKVFVAGAQTLAEDTAKLGEYAKINKLARGRQLIVSSNVVEKQMEAIAKRDGLTACEQVA